MKTLEQKRDELRAELEAVEKQIKDQKPMDGWYKDENGFWMAYLKDGKYTFGINSNGIWTNNFLGDYEPSYDRLATPEEVKQRLTDFVNKEGYKKGVKVKSLYRDVDRELEGVVDFDENFIYDHYYIALGSTTVWNSKDGWAKIITEPKFKVKAGHDNSEINSLQSWSHKSGAKFNITVKSKSMDLSDYDNFDLYELAKEIETFLNNKK